MDVYEKIKESRNTLSPFCQRLGIVVEELREGYARVTKTVGPEDLNPVGVPHGGVYFSMADTASGSAMASHGYLAVTVNADYNFLRSASWGTFSPPRLRRANTAGHYPFLTCGSPIRTVRFWGPASLPFTSWTGRSKCKDSGPGTAFRTQWDKKSGAPCGAPLFHVFIS